MGQNTYVIALALAGIALAQTDAEKEQYKVFSDLMDQTSYSWKPYTVETDDGWFLTTFRISGASPPRDDLHPIFFQHGAEQDANYWATGGLGSVPMSLVDRGYDVFLGNARGTMYSNVNVRADTETLKEHWDFSWAEMGQYDIPAFVSKVIEVTEKPKITLIGFSQGGSQSYYALAKNQDFFADKLHRFVALANCIYVNQDLTYESLTSEYLMYDKLGVYNLSGRDESSATAETNCLMYGPGACGPVEQEGGLPTKSFMYYGQIEVEKRFQEPISIEKYAAGERKSALVDLSNIDRVPVSMFTPISDQICSVENVEWVYVQIASPEKYIIFEHFGHAQPVVEPIIPFFGMGDRSIQRLVETIETGRPAQAQSVAEAAVLAVSILLTMSVF